jgi:flagellar motor switch protein FliM
LPDISSRPPIPSPRPKPREASREITRPRTDPVTDRDGRRKPYSHEDEVDDDSLTPEPTEPLPQFADLSLDSPASSRLTPPRAKPGSPALRQPRSFKSFRFSNLEKVGPSEVDLLSRVEWILPAEPKKALQAFQSRMRELFEQQTTVLLHHVYLSSPDKLHDQVPEPSCLFQIAVAPHLPRGLVEIELALAHACIDQLLGGSAGEAVVLRSLTEIEEGVLGYVMLEGLRALAPTADPERPRMRLEGALHGLDEALAQLRSEKELVALQFTAALGEVASGYFRIFLPAGALKEMEPGPDSLLRKLRRVALFEKNKGRLPETRYPLWAEIGHCELSVADLTSLSPGDVVLVENLTARPDKGEGGTAKLKVGLGGHGHWLADMAIADDGLHATLKELHLGGEASPGSPEAAPAAEPSSDESDSELPSGRTPESTQPGEKGEGGGLFSEDDDEEHTTVTSPSDKPEVDAPELLNDIPLHVAVEMARVQITAEEVVALRVGQVITLGRTPGDPVDLSVNGKIVAHGELVEVEGQLGVRVTALSG